MAAKVFAEQGITTIPSIATEPLASAAVRSLAPYSTRVPAETSSPYSLPRNCCTDSLSGSRPHLYSQRM